jgi:hypothetical protein
MQERRLRIGQDQMIWTAIGGKPANQQLPQILPQETAAQHQGEVPTAAGRQMAMEFRQIPFSPPPESPVDRRAVQENPGGIISSFHPPESIQFGRGFQQTIHDSGDQAGPCDPFSILGGPPGGFGKSTGVSDSGRGPGQGRDQLGVAVGQGNRAGRVGSDHPKVQQIPVVGLDQADPMEQREQSLGFGREGRTSPQQFFEETQGGR